MTSPTPPPCTRKDGGDLPSKTQGYVGPATHAPAVKDDAHNGQCELSSASLIISYSAKYVPNAGRSRTMFVPSPEEHRETRGCVSTVILGSMQVSLAIWLFRKMTVDTNSRACLSCCLTPHFPQQPVTYPGKGR